MVFYVNAVTFLVTLLMIKFTSIVTDEINANYWDNVWYILQPSMHVLKNLSLMIEI